MRAAGEAAPAAEQSAHGGPDRERPRPLAELRRSVDRLVTGDWWTQAGGPVVVVRSARTSARSSSARAAGAAVEVRLADGQLDIATVIHELAHALAGVEHGHDATFRRANVDVASSVAGAAAGDALLAAYRAFELAVAAPRWPAPTRAVGDGFVVLPS